jgi:hypothetical protein
MNKLDKVMAKTHRNERTARIPDYGVRHLHGSGADSDRPVPVF